MTIGSFAAGYQSRNYQGHISPNSFFSRFQSYGAIHHGNQVFHIHTLEEPEESPIATIISWLAGLSAMFILGREWGLWDVQVASSMVM